MIDSIQMHFFNAQSPMIGGNGGSFIGVSIRQSVESVIVRSDSERLYTLDFVAPGMRERYGNKNHGNDN